MRAAEREFDEGYEEALTNVDARMARFAKEVPTIQVW
jgi:hypothetical protein